MDQQPDDEKNHLNHDDESRRHVENNRKKTNDVTTLRENMLFDDANDSFSSHSNADEGASRPQEHLSQSKNNNFVLFSILFAANHAAGLACLALASARLGEHVGSQQTAILYLTYTLSSITCATAAALGNSSSSSKRAVVLGMWLFCAYVGCFLAAAVSPAVLSAAAAYAGAAIGGIGAGIAWTAQGAYFTQAATAEAASSSCSGRSRYQEQQQQSPLLFETTTSRLAAIFAFCVLLQETALDVLSTILVRYFHWSVVFAVYSIIAVTSTIAMQLFAYEYPSSSSCLSDGNVSLSSSTRQTTGGYGCFDKKATAALRLLVNSSRMKYMIGFNAAFAFAGAFLNSFVSGQVVAAALGSDESVGALVAIHGIVAAAFSLLFGKATSKTTILIVGSAAFASVAIPFLVRPVLQDWTWGLLVLVYSLEGLGRATFEGTLKALFADYFAQEDMDGAFANIILQYGLASAAAYGLADRFRCSTTAAAAAASANRYCVRYRDGTFHDIFSFAIVVIATSLAAIAGFVRASYLSSDTTDDNRRRRDELLSVHPRRSSLAGGRGGVGNGTVYYHTIELTSTAEENNHHRARDDLPGIS